MKDYYDKYKSLVKDVGSANDSVASHPYTEISNALDSVESSVKSVNLSSWNDDNKATFESHLKGISSQISSVKNVVDTRLKKSDELYKQLNEKLVELEKMNAEYQKKYKEEPKKSSYEQTYTNPQTKETITKYPGYEKAKAEWEKVINEYEKKLLKLTKEIDNILKELDSLNTGETKAPVETIVFTQDQSITLDDMFRFFDQTAYDWSFGNGRKVKGAGCSLASYANMLRYTYGSYFKSSDAYAKAVYNACVSGGDFDQDSVNLVNITSRLNKTLGLSNNMFYSGNGNQIGRGNDVTEPAARAAKHLKNPKNETAMVYFKAKDFSTAEERRKSVESTVKKKYGDDCDVEFTLRANNSTYSAFSSKSGHYTTMRERVGDDGVYYVVDDSVPKTKAEYKSIFFDNNHKQVPSCIQFESYELNGKKYDRVVVSKKDLESGAADNFLSYGGFDCLVTVTKNGDGFTALGDSSKGK